MSYDHVETVGGKMQWTQAAVRRRSPTNTANSQRQLTTLSSVGRKTEKWNVGTSEVAGVAVVRNSEVAGVSVVGKSVNDRIPVFATESWHRLTSLQGTAV